MREGNCQRLYRRKERVGKNVDRILNVIERREEEGRETKDQGERKSERKDRGVFGEEGKMMKHLQQYLRLTNMVLRL